MSSFSHCWDNIGINKQQSNKQNSSMSLHVEKKSIKLLQKKKKTLLKYFFQQNERSKQNRTVTQLTVGVTPWRSGFLANFNIRRAKLVSEQTRFYHLPTIGRHLLFINFIQHLVLRAFEVIVREILFLNWYLRIKSRNYPHKDFSSR